jgi:hypothetical protein
MVHLLSPPLVHLLLFHDYPQNPHKSTHQKCTRKSTQIKSTRKSKEIHTNQHTQTEKSTPKIKEIDAQNQDFHDAQTKNLKIRKLKTKSETTLETKSENRKNRDKIGDEIGTHSGKNRRRNRNPFRQNRRRN